MGESQPEFAGFEELLAGKDTNVEREPYFISEEEFSTDPTEIEPYQAGEQVTRKNFLSMLVRSFAVSRGVPDIQTLFLMWLEDTTGFDYKRTLTTFKEKGGWDALSEEERDQFRAAFLSVKIHSHKYLPRQHEDEIRNELEALEHRSVGEADERLLKVREGNNLAAVDSFDGFNRIASPLIQEWRSAKG